MWRLIGRNGGMDGKPFFVVVLQDFNGVRDELATPKYDRALGIIATS